MRKECRAGKWCVLLWVAICLAMPGVAAARFCPTRVPPAGADFWETIFPSLFLLADFELEGTVLVPDGQYRLLPFAEDHYCGGRFGRGFFFEMERQNQLLPHWADIEESIEGLKPVGQSSLRSVAARSSPFVRCELSVGLKASGDGFAVEPVSVRLKPGADRSPLAWLMASFYVQGPTGMVLRLGAGFAPAVLPPGKKNEPQPAAVPDTNLVQRVILNGRWQRVACMAGGDARIRERSFTLDVVSETDATAELRVDGMQYEQCNVYPTHRCEPSTWTTGGECVPTTSVKLSEPGLTSRFPAEAGTLVFWTRTPPPETNLKGSGSHNWFSFGQLWGEGWKMYSYSISAERALGADGKPKGINAGAVLSNIHDGGWHHLALCWGSTNGVVYRDGQAVASFRRERVFTSGQLAFLGIQLGTGDNGAPAAAVMDDLAIFSRVLSPDEIALIAKADRPLRTPGKTLAVCAGSRSAFFRDEGAARIGLSVIGDAGNGAVRIRATMGGLPAFDEQVPLSKGAAEATFQFNPALLACGDYVLRVSAESGGARTESVFPIVVRPSLRRDHFLISSWGGGLGVDWLEVSTNLNLNTLDLECAPELVDFFARYGFGFNWHYNFFRECSFSAKRRNEISALTAKKAGAYVPFPSWRGTLVNTETCGGSGLPDAEERRGWFDAWAREELGFDVPATNLWKIGSPHNHIWCKFPEQEKPGTNGVYLSEPESLRFLRWWQERGSVFWRVNALGAKEIKSVRPDNVVWTDPVCSYGQFDELDASSDWSYSISPEKFLGNFLDSVYRIKGNGKPFYATLGMDYVGPGWLTVSNAAGRTVRLMPTADDLSRQAWLVTTQLPTDGLTFWYVSGWIDGMKEARGMYAEPGSDRVLGEILKRDILPMGTLLAGMPLAAAPVALIRPESTLWMCAGEGRWNWGVTHYQNAWRDWLGQAGFPYEILYDRQLTPGSLARFHTVIYPMAQYVSEAVRRGLSAAGSKGTRIIVDSYCRQSYPNMERLVQHYSTPRTTAESGSNTLARLIALRDEVRSLLDAVAEGAAGPVFCATREWHGARYIGVVNGHRRAGPYTVMTGHPEFRPYGEAQKATVRIRVPNGTEVYDFSASRKVRGDWKDGWLTVTTELPSAGGRLFCLYPAACKRLTVACPDNLRRGQAAVAEITLCDPKGKPIPGRQLVDLDVADPRGRPHDEAGFYRMEDGVARVSVRVALNDEAGNWMIRARERATGLSACLNVKVRR